MSTYCYRCADFHETIFCPRRDWEALIAKEARQEAKAENREPSEMDKHHKAYLETVDKDLELKMEMEYGRRRR